LYEKIPFKTPFLSLKLVVNSLQICILYINYKQIQKEISLNHQYKHS